MALRFLADHCISNFIVQTLRDAKYEVFRLRDLLPVDSSDAVGHCKSSGSQRYTLVPEGDFADIVTYPPRNYRGIVALQMRNDSEPEAVRVMH